MHQTPSGEQCSILNFQAYWLYIYTDVSYLPETDGADMGWFCRLLEDSSVVGKSATNDDYKVLAVCEDTAQLLAAGLAPVKVVSFLVFQTLSSNTPNDCLNTIQYRTKVAELISYGWTVSLQCVSSHVGISDNERADQKAKNEAESSQPEVPLTLRRAKDILLDILANVLL
ncbi:reverse transcriptase [Trichonephila clavipes]|nr:reverse transcriptase [Trichonephila clavipes]